MPMQTSSYPIGSACLILQVNQALLSPLLEGLDPQRLAVGILDSMDLPASANDFKKKLPAVLGSPSSGGRAHRQKRAEPLVSWV